MRKRAFTLIELLVVISIIAVLMSILMPSLQKVKHQTKRVICGSNIKQNILAMQIYATDNSDKVPLNYPAWSGMWPWDVSYAATDLMLENGSVPEMFYCPSGKDYCQEDQFWRFTEWSNSSGTVNGEEPSNYDQRKQYYRLSTYLWLIEFEPNSSSMARREIDGRGNKNWIKTLAMNRAGEAEFVIDTIMSEEDSSGEPFFNPNDQYPLWPNNSNHLEGSDKPSGGNIGFVDGHVAWRDLDDMEVRFVTHTNMSFWW